MPRKTTKGFFYYEPLKIVGKAILGFRAWDLQIPKKDLRELAQWETPGLAGGGLLLGQKNGMSYSHNQINSIFCTLVLSQNLNQT